MSSKLTPAENKALTKEIKAGKLTNKELAEKYGVSASTISRMKKDLANEVPEPTKTKSKSLAKEVVAEKVEEKPKKVAKAKAVVEVKQQVIVVYAPNRIAEKYTTAAKTLGEFLKEIGENSQNLGAVFKNAKGARVRLEKSTDTLPVLPNGQELHLMLMPVKVDSGI